MKDRLQKIISASGLMSRRAAEECITAGRVSVNGVTAVLGDKADPETDTILLDGKALPSSGDKIYIMLNKPKGYVTTMKDEKGRKNVTELVKELGSRVYPVGRLDMYSEFIGKELVEFTRKVFPLSDKREDTIIGGISMGGFGSLINGMRHHETFGHIVAISPALVKYDIANSTDDPNPVGATRGFFASVFGDLDKYPESENNPAVLAARLKAEGAKFPSIYLACGRNDMLVMPARELHADLLKLGIAHTYVEGPGTHEDIFFFPHLRHGLSYLDLDRIPEMPNPFWIDG